MKKSKNTKYYFIMSCIYLLLFQNFLQEYIPFIQYYDELLSLIAIPVVVINLLKSDNSSIKKYNFYIIFFFILMIGVGFYSSFKYQYQSLITILSDFLLVSKFFLAYMLGEMLIDADFINDNRKKISKNVKFIITVFFLLTILNLLFKIWPQKSFRFGIMSNQIFYTHPTYLAASCVFLLALLILSTENYKKYLLFIVLILLSTLRFKAIGAASLIFFIVWYINKTNKKVSLSKIGIIAVFILMFAWNQVSYYYIDLDGSARKVLNETSIEIANDYFPVGTGFATFGSYFSMVEYSPIYYKYGISNIWGIEKGQISYVSDVFWPMIIGQFGFIGLIAYIIILYVMFKKIQDSFTLNDKSIYIAKIICFAYLIISSTSESAFVNSISIPLALIMGINTMKNKKNVKEIADEDNKAKKIEI